MEKLLAELCGIELSRGTIGRARAEINAAVESATVAAQEYVQQQPVVNVDETGFKLSLKAQSRSVLDFLTQSCQAYRLGTTPPTLIPVSESTFRNERIILL